jgi:hypothetical protein
MAKRTTQITGQVEYQQATHYVRTSQIMVMFEYTIAPITRTSQTIAMVEYRQAGSGRINGPAGQSM